MEVVGDSTEVLGDGTEVRAVGEETWARQGGDVFRARGRVGQTRLFGKARVGRRVAERILLDVVQRRCGARTPSSPAAAALAMPVLQGIAGRALSRNGLLCDRPAPVCSRGATLF